MCAWWCTEQKPVCLCVHILYEGQVVPAVHALNLFLCPQSVVCSHHIQIQVSCVTVPVPYPSHSAACKTGESHDQRTSHQTLAHTGRFVCRCAFEREIPKLYLCSSTFVDCTACKLFAFQVAVLRTACNMAMWFLMPSRSNSRSSRIICCCFDSRFSRSSWK